MGEKTDKLKGHAKESIGDLTDDPELQREGKVDRMAGNVKGKVGDAVDKAKDGVSKAKDRAEERRTG